jgi:hypothetical protein
MGDIVQKMSDVTHFMEGYVNDFWDWVPINKTT